MPMNYAELLNQQRHFFLTNATHDITFRKNSLIKLQQLIHLYEPQLYEAIQLDFHKSQFDTYTTEISMIYAEIRYFLRHLKHLASPKLKITNLANIPGRFHVQPEPLGNTLIIGAWNYPYQLTLIPAIAAIAAGNTCIIKPSELPIHTMEILEKIINKHFPPEFLYVASGDATTTTQLLQLHFDKIFFTGSPKIGRIVYQAAALQLTPVTLELGGKCPAIITANANLDIAVQRIVWGKFLNAGQTCVAPDYIYVDANILSKLLDKLKRQIQQNEYTDGSQQYVSIINQNNYKRLTQLISISNIYYGGNTNPQTLYIQPTIIEPVTWNDPIMQEEIFGPILPILSYTNLNEAISQIQQHPKPLAAYIFSTKKSEQRQFLTNISSGGVCINDVIMHLATTHAPFGGIGNSGIGSYHGSYGFQCFSHYRTIFRKPHHLELPLKYPPYSQNKLKWIKRFM